MVATGFESPFRGQCRRDGEGYDAVYYSGAPEPGEGAASCIERCDPWIRRLSHSGSSRDGSRCACYFGSGALLDPVPEVFFSGLGIDRQVARGPPGRRAEATGTRL